MKYVEIYHLNDDGTQRIIATCELHEDEVMCRGDESFVQSLTEEGIRDYSAQAKGNLLPSAGERFLEQLKFNFKSGYLLTSDIMEK